MSFAMVGKGGDISGESKIGACFDGHGAVIIKGGFVEG